MAQTTDSLPAKQQDGTVGETVVKTVGKTEREILGAIRGNPEITRQALSEITGLSVRGVEWNIAKLKAEGKLRRKGSDKFGYWEVVEDSHE